MNSTQYRRCRVCGDVTPGGLYCQEHQKLWPLVLAWILIGLAAWGVISLFISAAALWRGHA